MPATINAIDLSPVGGKSRLSVGRPHLSVTAEYALLSAGIFAIFFASFIADGGLGQTLSHTQAYSSGSPTNNTGPGNASADRTDGPPDNRSESIDDLPEPHHGLSPAIFPRLWSGDVDDPATTGSNASKEDAFLSAFDYPYTSPSEPVKTWNAGEHGDFPHTGVYSSVYPAGIDPSDASWIKDAYIEILAIQPSTVAHVAPDDRRQYVSQSGDVLGVTDYRIEMPPEATRQFDPPDPAPGERVLLKEVVTYRLINHTMGDIRLKADGSRIASTAPAATARIEYSGLGESTDRLSIQTNVSALVEKITRRKFRTASRSCDTRTVIVGNETRKDTHCDTDYSTHWSKETERLSQALEVRDSVDIQVYTLSPRITRTDFSDEQSALVINETDDRPWASVQLPSNSTVQNSWHFYSARDRTWETLVKSTENGMATRRSDTIPLEVHAFPSGGGAYARSGEYEVSHVWGQRKPAPNLPTNITVPVVEEPYATGSTLVTRMDEETVPDRDITVHGVVRDTQTNVSIQSTQKQRATDLDLNLVGINRSAGTVRVHLSLREATSGDPINLRSRPGHIEVNGANVETNASGEATMTVPLSGDFVSTKYQPGRWWRTDPIYGPARDIADIPAKWPSPRRLVTAGFTLLLWLSPLLLAIFVLDKLLDRGRLWPPWKGIR